MEQRPLIYVVQKNEAGKSVKELLSSRLHLSRSLVVKLKLQHKISVNGAPVFTNHLVQPGDRIAVDLELGEQCGIIPQPAQLSIVFEDADFLAVDKPAGMPVHPSKRHQSGTLANAVAHYWQQSGHNSLFRPINRLDKETSGLVLIGKNQFAHQGIFLQQQRQRVERRYLALVEGVLATDKGRISDPIARLEDRSRKRIVAAYGQSAVTNFTVLKRFQQHTLLHLSLETGRTHQIRVHLSHIGHPVCGDELYGWPSPFIARQALHAGELSFIHPRTGSSVCLAAPLPGDMLAALDLLRQQSV